MLQHPIPYGTTEYQDFTLKADGAAIDLTGLTLGIEITDADGAAVTSVGTASIVTADAADGHVRFAPSGTLPEGSYRVRWTVTASGRLFKVPNGDKPDVWTVVKETA